MNIGDKVKMYRRSENTNFWQELKDDRGNPYKGIIKNFSYNSGREPIFALVLIKEDENLYSEEFLAVNSNKFKLVRC